ncbi:MAG: hypothetical protein WAQ28_00845 [Bacteroidia bacterium]|jgi:hypothetical protein
MEIIERLKNRIYKNYSSASVEYHAGGFFIRKDAIYIQFNSNHCLLFLERKEGLHPNDSVYSELFNKTKNLGKINEFKLESVTENLLIYKSADREIKVMPSIFIENINNEKITEVLIDFGKSETMIFFYVYSEAEDNTL